MLENWGVVRFLFSLTQMQMCGLEGIGLTFIERHMRYVSLLQIFLSLSRFKIDKNCDYKTLYKFRDMLEETKLIV